MLVLGLDVGGANLKAATTDGAAVSIPFPLWKHPAELANALSKVRSLIVSGHPPRRLALTMTGELCDCFETKADGVAHIIAAAEQVFADMKIAVWQVEGRFVSTSEAVSAAWNSAASNWAALAHACAPITKGRPTLLVDVGSTTSDIIPIHREVIAKGLDDTSRLALGELLYQGVTRTPMCAILPTAPMSNPPLRTTLASHSRPCSLEGATGEPRFATGTPSEHSTASSIQVAETSPGHGQKFYRIRTMAELFATAHDAYVVLGLLPQDTECTDSADGRPMTQRYASSRLARMIGSDSSRFNADHAHEMALAVFEKQKLTLIEAMNEVANRSLKGSVEQVVTSGIGEFLVRAALADDARFRGVPTLSLAKIWGSEISKSACAFAVAQLLKSNQTIANKDLSSLEAI